MQRAFYILFVIGVFPSFGIAAAQTPAEPKSSDTQIGELVVRGAKENESPEKPSAFVSVIHPDDYQQQLTTLPELLSDQVGLHVQSFGGLGQLSTVSIRGSTAEQVSVYIDGIKINTAQGGAVDFSTIPLGAIDRVEILRGGASSQFGSDAIGGVINIVTKRAQPKYALELRYSEGSFFTIQTHEGFAKRFGNLGVVLDHTHFSSDGDFPFLSSGIQFAGGGSLGGGQEFTRLHNAFFSEGFLSSFDAELSEKLRLSFINDFFATSRDEPGTEVETTQLFPANPLNGHETLFRNAVGLRLVREDLGAQGLEFSLAPNYRFEHSHFTDATPAFGGPIDVSYLNQSVGVKPKWNYARDFGNHTHDLTLFYDFRYDHFGDSSPLPNTKLAGTHTRRINALFFQDEVTLLDEKIYFNPSVRYEHASDFGGDVAMHFGLVGKPASWVSLKTNIENSFRYPSFNELFFPDQGFLRGNPNLSKETAINFDVGPVFQYRWMSAELNYFRNDIHNSIVFVPISAFTIAPVNTGPVTAQGLEATLKLNPLHFLTLSGNYTYLHAQLNTTGKQLPGRPRHLANARLELHWKYGSVFSSLQYIDKLPIDFSNTRFVPQSALVDVGGTFEWKDRYFLTLQGKNVGNVQTFDSVGFPLPRASVYLSFGYKT